MPTFIEKYTDQQRDAVESAYNDRGVRPAARVAELAAAGELTAPDGERLPPFTVPENTIRSIARHGRKRRAGRIATKLQDVEPRDAVENLRRRLVGAADLELERVERQQRSGKTADTERLRQIARAVLEISRIPGPSDPRPPSGTTRDPSTGKEGPRARGGLAGEILKDHRQEGTPDAPFERTPSTTPLPTNTGDGDSDDTQRNTRSNEEQNTEQHGTPGSWAREQAARLLG